MKIFIKELYYIRNQKEILKNINLDLEQDFYVLVGPNGSGKSTFLYILSGMEWPSKGSVMLYESGKMIPVVYKKNYFGYFFTKLSNWFETYHPSINVIQTICTGFYDQLGYYTEATEKQQEIAKQLIFQYVPSLNLDFNKPFVLLSTGEKYRILLIRSIIKKPKILILDEPFDGLDIRGKIEFELAIKEISNVVPFMLFVLHKIEEIPKWIHKVILMKNGEIFQYGDIDQVLNSENMSRLYDIDLIVEKRNSQYYTYVRS